MSKPSSKAFSLVEVTLALGITAFCLVTLLSLLPIGLNTSRNAVAQTSAASVAGTVIADIRTQAAANARMPSTVAAAKSPQYGIDLTSTSVQTIYIDLDGSAKAVGASAPPTAVYRVSLAFITPAQPMTATPLRVLVTWPALAGIVPPDPWPKLAKVSGSFEIVTAVDLTR